LTAAGVDVRCLVRDPRRLGPERVRVQIALGDLADHMSFRHAVKGVDTVVHLAAPIRDQPGGSIEELAGVATWRLVRAAEREGVSRFVFFSAIGADTRSRSRLMRAKAIAERALEESSLSHTVFALSMAYAKGDPYLTLLQRMSWLPAIPIVGDGSAVYQPMWADDVADCVLATLPGGPAHGAADGTRYELAGPQTLTVREIAQIVMRSFGRSRPVVGVPTGLARHSLKLVELLMGPTAFATWDEAELLEISMTAADGTRDAERLGVTPRPMAEVLAV
jgi:NADH dehydrogenase